MRFPPHSPAALRWRRILKRVALGAVAALALLVLVGYLLSFTGIYQTWARGLILRTIEGGLKVEASLGAVGGNPLYGIKVGNLVLTREGQPLLSARRLSLSYFLPQVIFATPVVGVALEDFDLNVIRTAEGLNVEDLLKPREPAAGGQVVVSSLRLADGKVVYTDATTPPQEKPLVIEDLNIEGGLGLPASPEQPLVVRLQKASLRMRRPEVILRSARGTLRRGPEQTSLDLEVAAKVAPAEVELALSAAGVGTSLESARGSGRLDIRHYELEQLKGIDLEGGYDFSLAAGTLTISRGELKAPGAVATFSGLVPRVEEIASRGGSASVTGKLAVRDLAALSRRPQLSGSADIDFRLQKGWRPQEGLSVAVSAKAARATVAGFELTSASLEGSWRPSAVEIASLRADSRAGQVRISGSYRPDAAMDLDFSAQAKDIGPLASRLGATKIASGSLSAAGKLLGTPSSPAARGSFSGRRLSYGELAAEQASGSFEGENLLAEPKGRLTASLSGVQAKGLKLAKAKVSASTTGRGAVEFSADAQEGPGGPSYRAEGLASGLGEQRTTISLARVEAQVAQLAVRNTRELPVVLAEGTVQLPQVALAATDDSLGVTGSAEAPGQVDMRLRFEKARIEDIVRLIRVNFPVQGRLTGTAKIAGTTGQPRIDADLDARSGMISAVPFDRLSAKIDYAAEEAKIDATLIIPGGQKLALQGSVPMKVTLLPPKIETGPAGSLLPGLGRQIVPRLFKDLLKGLPAR